MITPSLMDYAFVVAVVLLGIMAGFILGRHLGWRQGWRDGHDFYDVQFGGHMRLLDALVRNENERVKEDEYSGEREVVKMKK